MLKMFIRVIACCAFAFPWIVSAETITTAPCTLNLSTTCATGITGLVTVGGINYDVAFNNSGSYNTIYAGGSAPTFGSTSDAQNVASAIVSSLSSSTTIDGIVANAGLFDIFYVPYDYDPNSGTVSAWQGYKEGGGAWSVGVQDNFGNLDPGTNYFDLLNSGFAYNWVVFTPAGNANTSEAPEPGALALLGLGLAGLGFARRKELRAA